MIHVSSFNLVTFVQGNTFQLVLMYASNVDAPRTAVIYLYESINWQDTGFIRGCSIGTSRTVTSGLALKLVAC